MTPSTISHHVRDLEARLGAPLFTKQGRGVALTAEGEQYFRTLRQAFELLRGTVLEAADRAAAPAHRLFSVSRQRGDRAAPRRTEARAVGHRDHVAQRSPSRCVARSATVESSRRADPLRRRRLSGLSVAGTRADRSGADHGARRVSRRTRGGRAGAADHPRRRAVRRLESVGRRSRSRRGDRRRWCWKPTAITPPRWRWSRASASVSAYCRSCGRGSPRAACR